MYTLKFKRGLDADRIKFVPMLNQILLTTDTRQLYVGDGVTAGGILIGTLPDFVDLDAGFVLK